MPEALKTFVTLAAERCSNIKTLLKLGPTFDLNKSGSRCGCYACRKATEYPCHSLTDFYRKQAKLGRLSSHDIGVIDAYFAALKTYKLN